MHLDRFFVRKANWRRTRFPRSCIVYFSACAVPEGGPRGPGSLFYLRHLGFWTLQYKFQGRPPCPQAGSGPAVCLREGSGMRVFDSSLESIESDFLCVFGWGPSRGHRTCCSDRWTALTAMSICCEWTKNTRGMSVLATEICHCISILT